MDVQVLPLAITMLVGPGLMADIVLITAPKPVRLAVAFVLGVAIATTVGELVALAAKVVLPQKRCVSGGAAPACASVRPRW